MYVCILHTMLLLNVVNCVVIGQLISYCNVHGMLRCLFMENLMAQVGYW